MKQSQKRQWSGFSLVELVIAIAVIGIMSAAAVPLIKNTLDKTRNTRSLSELEEFRNGSISFYGDTFALPGAVDCDGAVALYLLSNNTVGPDMTAGAKGDLNNHFGTNCSGGNTYTNANTGGAWRGPYMSNNRLDPWGTSYSLIRNSFSTTEPAMAITQGSDRDWDTASDFATNAGAITDGDVGLSIILE